MADKQQTVEEIWEDVCEPVLNNIKVHLLKNHVAEILHFYTPKIEQVTRRYLRHLPRHVVDSEVDDLSTIAKLEFLETLKVWNPVQNRNIWPLAQSRIMGAMKDHIRYITKSDPSRFYEWMNDAAHIYLMTQEQSDFENDIENGMQLNKAMKCLDYRERKIVLAHTREDLTFREIGEQLSISESQTSRVYKKALEKMRKHLSA